MTACARRCIPAASATARSLSTTSRTPSRSAPASRAAKRCRAPNNRFDIPCYNNTINRHAPGRCESSGRGRRHLAGRSPRFVGGAWPSRGALPRCGVCGTMQASSPTWVCYNAGSRFPRLAAGLPWFVGEGFIPPAGVPAAAGCGGMRASRPTAAGGRVPFPFGWAFAMVCRGGPWPSRGTLPCRGVPGTMRASSPTWVRYNAGLWFPGWPRACRGS